MKQVIGMLLMVFATSSAHALSIKETKCTGGNGYGLHLVRGERDTMRGFMQDAYNSAEIICEQGGWGSLTYQGPMKCIGLWQSAYDSDGQPTKRIAEITMRMGVNLPDATATYVRNWDERNPDTIVTKVLSCEVEIY